jgi:hypothetical protein
LVIVGREVETNQVRRVESGADFDLVEPGGRSIGAARLLSETSHPAINRKRDTGLSQMGFTMDNIAATAIPSNTTIHHTSTVERIAGWTNFFAAVALQ